MWEKQLIRVLAAVDILSSKSGATKQELVERLDVSIRTIDRIFADLRALQIPLDDEWDSLAGEKRWRLSEDYAIKLPNITIPDLRLTSAELIYIHLIRSQERLLRGTGIETTAGSVLNKFSFFVPGKLSKEMNKAGTLFLASGKFSKNYKGKETIIDDLGKAMLKQKRCSVEYHSFSSGKRRDYDLAPLRFFENNAGLYIFAHIADYDEIRTLAVERIEGLKITEVSFDYLEDFDPEKLLCSSFGIIVDEPIQVKIKFSKAVAPYIRERTWAPDQCITENETDGSVVLEMNICGWLDVKRWALSYGADAEVLEPPKMRKEIMEELKSCCTIYRVDER
jgi:predicted DNA-binding transcriptional regulator YafY